MNAKISQILKFVFEDFFISFFLKGELTRMNFVSQQTCVNLIEEKLKHVILELIQMIIFWGSSEGLTSLSTLALNGFRTDPAGWYHEDSKQILFAVWMMDETFNFLLRRGDTLKFRCSAVEIDLFGTLMISYFRRCGLGPSLLTFRPYIMLSALNEWF